MRCNDCPRNCNVDRETTRGFCGAGVNACVAKTVAPFEYEEPCLGRLSAVFFGGCSLRCSYCQNVAISRRPTGEEHTDTALAKLFDGAIGALDLVTPTHYLSAIERALPLCEKEHRIIYNTSGYETLDAVKRAARFTDVFLTDIKYFDAALGKRFSAAPDYFEHAGAAVKAMRERRDEWRTDELGAKILTRGLIVRHLVLPGCARDSMKILDFIAAELGTDTVISLMSQFTPNGVGAPDVPLKKLEYKLVAEHALKLGLCNGYFQDFDSADSKYTPDFRLDGSSARLVGHTTEKQK